CGAPCRARPGSRCAPRPARPCPPRASRRRAGHARASRSSLTHAMAPPASRDAAADRARVPPALAPAAMSEEGGVRYLHLGTPWIQGAMRCARPLAIELEYIQRMMAWMLWRPAPEVAQGHAVQLGLGAATLTRFAHRVLRMRVTAVEIN